MLRFVNIDFDRIILWGLIACLEDADELTDSSSNKLESLQTSMDHLT